MGFFIDVLKIALAIILVIIFLPLIWSLLCWIASFVCWGFLIAVAFVAVIVCLVLEAF